MFVFQGSIIPPAQVVIVSALLIDKNDPSGHPFPAAHLAILNIFPLISMEEREKEMR